MKEDLNKNNPEGEPKAESIEKDSSNSNEETIEKTATPEEATSATNTPEAQAIPKESKEESKKEPSTEIKKEDLVCNYKRGEVLFKEGDETKDLYIIQSGTVKIYKKVAEKLLPLALVKRGQFVGELSFFDDKPRSASAEAATDLRVIKLDQLKLENEMKKLPSWLLVLIKSIAERVRSADDLVQRNQIVDAQIDKQFKKLS